MIKISDKRTAYFDVDETLIMWNADVNDKASVLVDSDDGCLVTYAHNEHIELMKNLKAIGWNIVVWSQGGPDHAERAIKALKLEKYVDIVMPKPEIIVDDIPFEQQYIKRVYKEFKR